MDFESRRDLWAKYSPSMAYVAVTTSVGDESIGSAFHVGEGVFVTARHVVEGVEIREIATTESFRIPAEDQSRTPPGAITYIGGRARGKLNLVRGPLLHPDPEVDVAAFVVDYRDLPAIPLGDHLDDWLGSEFILSSAIVMGYPPVPTSAYPVLVSAGAEVNAVVDRYGTAHPHFVLSTMARGGFSGGVALSQFGFALGVITESLSRFGQPPEAGFLAALTVEPIYNCLAHHRILPLSQRAHWDGHWSSRNTFFYKQVLMDGEIGNDAGSVTRRLDPERPGILITSRDPTLLAAARAAASAVGPHTIRDEKAHLVEFNYLAATAGELATILGRAARAAVDVFRARGGLKEAGDSQDGDDELWP
ncbi:S1 family peptidase [Corallococcus exiguus]|uniref:S1 family peptidase n=1 Tax=Corallococcus exiguus TaxID=83462 RepID=UPI0014714823|nr:serine protease [Corallococcus exiguus]NNB84580.1 trypsin-like peptidase domain-containing protein [Corallococcus exiguus]